MDQRSWRNGALCQTVPDLPWISDLATVSLDQLSVIEAICGACMVCFECLEYAGCHDVTAGFWAGAFRQVESMPAGELA
jgi:hypothetical protein